MELEKALKKILNNYDDIVLKIVHNISNYIIVKYSSRKSKYLSIKLKKNK